MDPRFNVIITIVAIVVTFVKCRQIKDKRKRIIVIMAILLVISTFNNRSIYWFLYWDGPYHGQVIDANTGEPIEGAAVAGIWELEYFILFIYSNTHFANAKETVTDADGKFKLPLTFAFTFWPFSALDRINLLVFKPGYDSNPPSIRRPKKGNDGKVRDYLVGKWVQYEMWEECVVRLNKARSIDEMLKAVPSIPGFDTDEDKLRNFVEMTEKEYRHLRKLKMLQKKNF